MAEILDNSLETKPPKQASLFDRPEKKEAAN
jgi:hypothetical protein